MVLESDGPRDGRCECAYLSASQFLPPEPSLDVPSLCADTFVQSFALIYSVEDPGRDRAEFQGVGVQVRTRQAATGVRDRATDPGAVQLSCFIAPRTCPNR